VVLRRPPFGVKVKSAHDMKREYDILSALKGVYGRAPMPIAFCDDESLIGAKFYLMERVRGMILRGDKPAPGITFTPELMRKSSTGLVDNLADLHAIDVTRPPLSSMGRPQGYVARQVTGWTERYYKAKTDEVPGVEAAAAWLARNMPRESGAAVIHNDYKYDNVMLDPNDLTRIVAVLDWEMATVGDPLMDLGSFIGYWGDPDDPQNCGLARMARRTCQAASRGCSWWSGIRRGAAARWGRSSSTMCSRSSRSPWSCSRSTSGTSRAIRETRASPASSIGCG